MESLIGYGSDDDYDESSQSKKQAQVPSQVDANYEEVQMDLSEDSNDSSRRQSFKDTKHKEESHDKFRRSSDHRHESTRSSPKRQESNRRRSRDRDDRGKKRHRDDRGRRNKDERDDRRSYRGTSRERHRSRSPRRSDYGKRSSSHERTRSGYSKRYDRASNKMDRLEKLGIELGASSSESAGTSGEMFVNKDDQGKNRFFMPGITGRFTEQIQRRKLLWQKKDNKTAPAADVRPVMPQGQKVWQNTTFAQDTDGKVANKFKRLMGIKEQEMGMGKSTNENLKKQEEMFTSMEAQYEVARTATHTMRGVGLGFGSFQR
ncbi:hypothetical protein FQR65_LT13491 [Abscondita terminalis]|nr:hypothetical protein FQR65_LT13491 [Abscondita terminalis]